MKKPAPSELLISARHGNPVAQNRVARLYATGRGVTADPVEAMKWHVLAKQGGRADVWLDDFTIRLSTAVRKEGEARARAFTPEAGNPGSGG